MGQLGFNPSQGLTAVLTLDSGYQAAHGQSFQPLKGTHGRSDDEDVPTFSTSNECFNPSKGLTAVLTLFALPAIACDNLFQPLKGTHGRSDSSYPQWERTGRSVPYFCQLWATRPTFAHLLTAKCFISFHRSSSSEGLPKQLPFWA